MRTRLAVLFFAMVLSESAFADFVQIVARAKPAVVQLEIQTGHGLQSGTGFFISSDGYLVTNAHVIAGALNQTDITVTANNGTQYSVESLAYLDQEADIAILKLDCHDVAYLQPETDDNVAEGQSVLVIGNPEGLQGTVSNGLVAAIRTNPNLIQITAPISPGSSGSPVLNEAGRVIGVAAQIYRQGQNLNFAIPVAEVRRGMASISNPGGRGTPRVSSAPPSPQQGFSSPNLVQHAVAQTQEDAERELKAAYSELCRIYDPLGKELLRKEQLAWLKQRERLQNDPNAFLKMTMARISHLRAALSLS
jgi:S1-C subfamily serine protease